LVDVIGIADEKVYRLNLGTSQTLIATNKGNAIGTFYQVALLGRGTSVLSCLQMEAFGLDINDRSSRLPKGEQRILVDGYRIQLYFQDGLPYLRCRKPTEEEVELLPHIIMTSSAEWNPCVFDNDNEVFCATLSSGPSFHYHGELPHVEVESIRYKNMLSYAGSLNWTPSDGEQQPLTLPDGEQHIRRCSPVGGESSSNVQFQKSNFPFQNCFQNSELALLDAGPTIEQQIVPLGSESVNAIIKLLNEDVFPNDAMFASSKRVS